MNALGWLVLGLLIGWAIEFAIDFLYWRKKAQEEAEALAQQESVLLAQQTELGHRQATLRLREKEMADLQASLASRDAELLQQARRVEERSDDLSRVEQAIEKRRADLDRMGLTLNEREKEIAARGEQLRSKEVNYNRRLDTLESTEAELARRVAVVSNREEAMQSWEGRILSREHDVADREASVNYHANRIANDAAGYEAVKHLLKQHYRTAEGRDRLQALVGIDDRTVELLNQAGIRTFERLAETSMGELTRLMEAAGPRFALANPLSWAEQAGLFLAEDWVALDELQAELKGEKRENVAAGLLAAMRRRPGAQTTEAQDTSADQASETVATEAAEATVQPDDDAAAGEAQTAHDAQAADDASSSYEAGLTGTASTTTDASVADDSSSVESLGHDTDAESADDEGAGIAESTLDQEAMVWGSDAGDEYEAEADEGLASVFVNPRRERTVEHVVAEVVDAERHEQGWRSGDDVSDAHVLSEHASGSSGHTAAADPAGASPESHPYGQAHRP
ncbi:MAG: hypothetical protein HXM45_11025 [Lautropia mirabilis]|nr:hypothetical protein [Lautropia mirabilis]